MLNSYELVELLYGYLETEAEINGDSLLRTLRDMERDGYLRYIPVYESKEANYLAVDIFPDPDNKDVSFVVDIHKNRVRDIEARDFR